MIPSCLFLSNENITNNFSEELNNQFQSQDFCCKPEYTEIFIQLTKCNFFVFTKIEKIKI